MINTSQLQIIHDRIVSAIDRKKMSMALEQLDSMAQASSAPWNVRGEIERLRQSYGYLRAYALDGADDPARERMLQELSAGIIAQSEAIMRLSRIEASPEQYYSVLRYEKLQPASSLISLIGDYREVSGRLAMAMLSDYSSTTPALNALKKEHDDIRRHIFELVWVTHPLSTDEADAILDFITDRNIRVEFREHILCAVMLGAMAFYDEKRMIILARAYLSQENRLEVKALVALVLSIWMQRSSISGHAFRKVMETVREHRGWHEDLKMAFLNLVRTRDTDRISRTMTEEVIPEMMKLRPEIFKKFKDLDNIEDPSALEDNPEWEELLEKSGITDKLKELNDLQTEGGDVMLSTFKSLKQFPFFNRLDNWFLPFFTDQTDVTAILDDSADDLGEIIDLAPLICDSDKYSMVFSLERIPSSSRRMMIDQFRMQNINVAELRNSMLNPELTSRSNMANHFIHDLYRFFTLYRRKAEFSNPFSTPINLAAVEMLGEDISDTLALDAVGEFYFKRGYFAEALDIFRLLQSGKNPSNALLQKIGYCYQRLGDTEKALEYYRKSELLASGGRWLQRRIAQCLKLLGRHEEALPYYEKLAEAAPEDLGLALNLGHIYLALGRYDMALKCYYKVEYLDAAGEKSWRPIAWCSFVEGDYERAAKYYEKILSNNPTAADWLNLGHLHLARGNFREAARAYGKFLSEHGNDVAALDGAVAADMEFLRRAKIDPTMLALVIDAAQYPSES